MIDVVTVGAGGGSVAWVSPEGALKVGPRSAGADPGPLCYGRGGTEPTVTDAHVVLGRIPPHLLGGEIPLDVERPRAGLERARRRARARRSSGAPPASSRSPPGTRPTPCARSPSSAGSTCATSRWRRSAVPARCCCAGWSTCSGCRRVVPRDPGNVSAFGLLTVDVRNDYVQTAVSRHDDLDLAVVAQVVRRRWRRRPRRRSTARASPATSTATCAAPTCATSVRPSRCGCRCPTGDVDAGAGRCRGRRVPRRARAALRLLVPRRPAPAGRVGQPAGVRRRPDPPPRRCAELDGRRRRRRARADRATRRCASTDWVDTPRLLAARPRAGRRGRRVRRSSRSSARPCRCTPASAATVDRSATCCVHEERTTCRSTVDPVLVEIVAGHPGRDREGGRDRDRRGPRGRR